MDKKPTDKIEHCINLEDFKSKLIELYEKDNNYCLSSELIIRPDPEGFVGHSLCLQHTKTNSKTYFTDDDDDEIAPSPWIDGLKKYISYSSYYDIEAICSDKKKDNAAKHKLRQGDATVTLQAKAVFWQRVAAICSAIMIISVILNIIQWYS